MVRILQSSILHLPTDLSTVLTFDGKKLDFNHYQNELYPNFAATIVFKFTICGTFHLKPLLNRVSAAQAILLANPDHGTDIAESVESLGLLFLRRRQRTNRYRSNPAKEEHAV
jgi:hypothetical protein